MATQLNDAKLTAVYTLLGVTTGNVQDRWHEYLRTETLATGTVNDLEMLWLTGLGYTTGALNDRWRAYLSAEGYTGSTSDQTQDFWEAGGPATGGGSFAVEAIDFVTNAAYAYKSTALTVTNNKNLLVSFWIKRNVYTSQRMVLQTYDAVSGWLVYLDANTMYIQGFRTFLGINDLDVSVASVLPADTNWHHVILSFDMTNSANRYVVVDGVSKTLTVSVYNNQNFHHTSPMSIGALVGNTWKISADLAEIFFHNSYLDLSVSSNVEKFRSADGKPVDLGADGSTPLGVQPVMYLHAASGEGVTEFFANDGSGGAINNTFGPPLVASTSPSD